MSKSLVSIYIICIIAITQINAQGVSNQLFKLLESSYTNVHFNNLLEDTKDHNIMIYSNFYGGAGIGIADINNDGLDDLYFAGNQVHDKLYINKGNLQFEDISNSAGLVHNNAWSSGVLMADVNNDGWLDIYVTSELYDDNPELRRNKLYINNHDNTFTESAKSYGIDDSQRTRHATFIDYDKDGDLDLYLLNQPPNPGDYSKFYGTELLRDEFRAKLYENQGESFIEVTIQAGLNKTGFPNSVTASDLNGDGWTDLFVGNDFYAGDWYFINNGDGTFTDKSKEYLKHTSFSSMGVDAADINNDGMLDIGVVDMIAEDNYRQKANMSGMNPAAFWKVVEDGGHHQYMFNMLHLNNGDGYMSDIAQLAGVASTDWSWSILMADFDNDGWKDIHITNGLMRDIRNKDASKEFPKYLEKELYKYVKANPNPEDIGVWDIVDIKKALSLIPSEKLSNYIFKNNGGLTFTKKVKEWGIEEATFSNGSAYSDLDNDGDLDLVINNINDKASIYQNRSEVISENNYLRIKPTITSNKATINGVKVWINTSEGNQFFEITGVRGMYSTSEQVAHFGVGSIEVIDSFRILWPDGKEYFQTKIQANQEIEVPYRQSNSKTKQNSEIPNKQLISDITEDLNWNFSHIENEFDDYKSQVLLPHKMSTFGPCISVGDINGDKLDDFYVGGSVLNPGLMYIQDKMGDFNARIDSTFSKDKVHEDIGSSFFDADNDGDLDLYVISGGNEFLKGSKAYKDRLYINDGKGGFSKSDGLPDLYSSGSKVRPFDYDKDGDLDLFIAGRHIPWAYPEAPSSTLLENNNGVFSDVTNSTALNLIDIGMVNDAVWIDVDNDQWTDLVLVGEWMAPTVLKNDKGVLKKMVNTGIQDQVGWWFSIETADIDNDGDMDFVAGNLGENYKYKASKEEPFEVYFYDFDDNKKKDIVLTYYNFGIQYPLRGKQCSSEQVPSLNETFETYDIFATSDVSKIYGEDNLESALHYEATTFATSYFENKGDGKFFQHKLPTIAQLSSINDILLKDYNRDGNIDILMGGNLFNAEVETARNDAGYGIILLGNGEGNFEPVSKEESGLFIPNNVKSLEIIQSNKDNLILVGNNNDRLQILKLNN